MQIVIPMAGDSKRFKEYGFDQPKYLIEVLGKTLLERSLSSLPLHLATKLIFIIKQEHEDQYKVSSEIESIIDKLDSERSNKELYFQETQFIFLKESTRGQTETVLKAKKYLDSSQALIIYNIDTQFEYNWEDTEYDKFIDDGLILAVKKEGQQWSFAEVGENGYVKQTAEKERISDNALVGLYHFKKASYFIEAAEDQINNNKTSKGEYYVAPIYNYLIQKQRNFVLDFVDSFIPLGTPEEVFDFIRSQSKMTKPRSFNTISIENQTVVKSSKNKFKMGAEFAWLKRINHHHFLKKYIPVPISLGVISIRMEQIPMPSLSEIFLYQQLTHIQIKTIFDKLFDVLVDFRSFCNPIPLEGVHDLDGFWSKMYVEKTEVRVKQIFQLEHFKGFPFEFKVNGNKVEMIETMPFVKQLSDDIIPAYFHGDYCLPNILYSLEYDVVKLIDPRGELVGDQRYDLAKLRHSFSGYDLIINDYYELKEINEKEFEYTIFWNHNFNKKNLSILDQMIVNDTSLKVWRQIIIIEALLFLTMIPLHNEDPKRQKMFYILAMEKFTNILNTDEQLRTFLNEL